ncbi:MAG: hypothetical protein ACTSU4_09475 [Promethearchaeota archaeon]
MSTIEQIFNDVLEEIKPTSKELRLISDIVNLLTTLLIKKADELNIQYTRMEPQGSTGIKQTQLRDDFDIDFFIGLNYENYELKYKGLSKSKKKQEFKKEFLRLCNDWLLPSLNLPEFQNARLLYAEHPYVTVDYINKEKKVKIDIVLYFDLPLEYINKYGPITAVDRTPWHGRFIQKELNTQQKNEVRLLKQFFKACHSYGDKSPVGRIGFIGYSAELLIYFYKTLLTVFQNFETLKEYPLDKNNRTLEQLKQIRHFQNDWLFIIDPIDSNRNVASAISEKAYNYCNHRIHAFLNQPDKKFFEITPIPPIDLTKDKDLLSHLFIIEFKKGKENLHYTVARDKLYSLGESIKIHGEKEFSHAKKFGKIEFEVYFIIDCEEYNLALYCEDPEISKSYLRRGPPLKAKKHAKKFKEVNPNHVIKNGFLWVETVRTHHQFLSFLQDHVKKNLPSHLKLVNLSNAFNVKTDSGMQALYVLKNMILPFCS